MYCAADMFTVPCSIKAEDIALPLSNCNDVELRMWMGPLDVKRRL